MNERVCGRQVRIVSTQLMPVHLIQSRVGCHAMTGGRVHCLKEDALDLAVRGCEAIDDYAGRIA
jgi:hypothetical protein